jgi:hypothetical protein
MKDKSVGPYILWLEDWSQHASLIEWKSVMWSETSMIVWKLLLQKILMACVYHYENNADIVQTISEN